MKDFNINQILDSYLESALWTCELDIYSISDFSEQAILKSRIDIRKFLINVEFDSIALKEIENKDEKYIGHNLWLSRNHHGAGFFDDDCNKLQELAGQLPFVDGWVGSDNKIYFE